MFESIRRLLGVTGLRRHRNSRCVVTELDSSFLATVEYDGTWRVLEVKMRGGEVYRYSEVPPRVHRRLLRTDSHGRYYNKHIRGRYDCDRVLQFRCGGRLICSPATARDFLRRQPYVFV